MKPAPLAFSHLRDGNAGDFASCPARYPEIAAKFPRARIYGLGDHVSRFFRFRAYGGWRRLYL